MWAYTLAGFAESGGIGTVVHYVVEFVKEPPANVEGFERSFVPDQLIEISKINLD